MGYIKTKPVAEDLQLLRHMIRCCSRAVDSLDNGDEPVRQAKELMTCVKELTQQSERMLLVDDVGIGELMDSICESVPEGMTVDSSDNDHKSGEIYIDSPAKSEKFLVKVTRYE